MSRYNELPAFIEIEDVMNASKVIRNDIDQSLQDGLELFSKQNGVEISPNGDTRQIWQLAAKLSLFNAVYFISREEAVELSDFGNKYSAELDEAGRIIDSNDGIAPIANFALHQYVHNFDKTEGRSVMTVKKSTPKYAIQGYDQNTIAVKGEHFKEEPPKDCFVDEERHDWHDLVHVLAGAASQGKFGVKYHNGLDRLPKYYRQLTAGIGASDASGPKFSDGLIFSQLSLPLFDNKNDQNSIAQEIYQYLKGEEPLLHPQTKEYIQAAHPIDPLELAVCLQNKRYERRAAEMEKFMIVRGTPKGPRGNPQADPLLTMPRSERLTTIAGLSQPLYFESRNLTRHRAHEQALGMIAIDMQDKNPNSDLVNMMVDFYHLTDLNKGYEINLYDEVEKQLN